jgi:ABC-2 type transport system ATP-binding protein
MQEVEAVCGRAIIIDKGRIIADGNPAILTQVSGPSVTIEVEFNRKPVLTLLNSLPGVISVTPLGETAFRIEASQESDIRPAIFHHAVEQGLTVLSMNRVEHSLEEVFQQLTKK